jgi:RHS repeat-associated protein
LFAYGTPTDQTDFLKANNLENKVDPNHVSWYWQTDIVLQDVGNEVIVLWQDPNDVNSQVVIDQVDYQAGDADNAYYDITQPSGTARPSVITLRRDLTDAIERRQTMYEEYGIEAMYFEHLNGRLDQTVSAQIQYLENQQEEGWEFNPEVATGEVTTTFYANYENAYIPHAPEDYTLSPYQWYEASEQYGASQNSTSQSGTVTYNTEPFKYRRERGVTYYELSNHLGNVLVTVTDMKVGISTNGDDFAEYYEATVVSAVDYYPFGSAMAGRKFNDNSYRYGFNGMEKDDEVKGNGNSYDFGARLYDSRVGKWLAIDPLAAEYVPISPYVFTMNKPILYTDFDGRVIFDPDGNEVTITEKTRKIVKNDPAFGNYTVTESYIEIEGGSEELQTLLFDTYQKDPTTIEKLNASDVKATIILETKRVIYEKSGRYGEGAAQSTGYTASRKDKKQGFNKIYYITLFAIDVNNEIVKNEITENNGNDFVVIELDNGAMRTDFTELTLKKQQKIKKELETNPLTSQSDLDSDALLTPDELSNYNKVTKQDRGKNMAKRRNVNSLIFETANAEGQAQNGKRAEGTRRYEIKEAETQGEAAAKRAVHNANPKED